MEGQLSLLCSGTGWLQSKSRTPAGLDRVGRPGFDLLDLSTDSI